MIGGNNGGNDAERVLNGRYQLLNEVGGGGMARVYKARDNMLGRIVAVKMLREQYTNDSQFVERFRREAQAAANLAHPNIVNIYDVGQDGDLYYIIMEYIQGESLKELITRSAPLPNDTAVAIAIQILSALEYAHRSGLIHRDIKPQNVLITAQGSVKVTDFGIAKSVSDLGLTEAGIALGTAHYFSPEQAKGERVVPQSDIYAVGVTLFEMLTGRIPFESESAIGLAYKHINEVPARPSQLNPNVPPRLDAIVLKAMAKDPMARFSSAVEMERALNNMEKSGQQTTAALQVPVVRPNVTVGRSRDGKPAASGRTYPGSAGTPTLAVASAGASARHMASPLAAPSSIAMRPTSARIRSGGSGCVTAGIGFIAVGLLAVLIVAAVLAREPIGEFLATLNPVIPSPTPTPIVPTPTHTYTPSPTPTFTPTESPTPTNTPISVAVPKLVGLKVGDAKVLAAQSGFVLEEVSRTIAPEWPEGVVFQQDPQPDSILKKTSVVQVRVSAGPPFFKLPQLTNTNPDDAKAALETAGVQVKLSYEGSLNITKGVVTRSDPPGGSSVRPGDIVTIYISLGETSVVPDLTGMTQDLATQTILNAGLTVGAITEVGRAEVGDDIDKVPPGTVYSQDPQKGVDATKGGPVNFRLRRRE